MRTLAGEVRVEPEVMGLDLVPYDDLMQARRKERTWKRCCFVIFVSGIFAVLFVQTSGVVDAVETGRANAIRLLAGDADGHSAEDRAALDSILFNAARRGE